jgi:cation:H+ antiporter
MMFVSILFYLFILDLELGFIEGLVFFILIVGFNYWSINKSRRTKEVVIEEQVEKSKWPAWTAVLVIVVASVALVYGSDLLVKGATRIAYKFGVSERVISVSMVAVGTSIPELATSVAAALKKELDISIGNIIGSNIFNLLAILGITSMLHPISINPMIVRFDIFWMLGISLLLFLFMLPVKNSMLSRWKGGLLLLVYAAYIFIVYKMG